MGNAVSIIDDVFLVGGPEISHPQDATVFIIDCGTEYVMVDSGSGKANERLVENIEDVGVNPLNISTLILTHCHIDHVGGAAYFKKNFDASLVVHEGDAGPLELGDPVRTAAAWYETDLMPIIIDRELNGDSELLNIGNKAFHCLHTPGHTPGSISVFFDHDNERILFGQDIHGPFLPTFGSDIDAWKESMNKLLAVDADILCEGHFGIFTGKKNVRDYILKYLKMYE